MKRTAGKDWLRQWSVRSLAVLTVLWLQPSHALDLLQAYRLARQNDPLIHAAGAARRVGEEEADLGRAGLLPRASVNYLRNRTWQAEHINASAPQAAQSDIYRDVFDGRRASVSIEQPLFDYAAVGTYQMGLMQADLAGEQYRLQEQQLIVRVIQTYLDAWLARETADLAERQMQIYADMLQSNERMMALGEASMLEILETRSQLGAVHATQLAARNTLADRLDALQIMLGEPVRVEQLRTIDVERAEVPRPDSEDLATLREVALQQSTELRAARLAVNYHERMVQRDKGQFMPRVMLHASHDRIESDTVNNKGRNYRSNTIGVAVSIPLFSGGSALHAVRQSQYRLVQSQHELDDTINRTLLALESDYRLCASSLELTGVLRQNVADGERLAQAMRKSVAGGERTNMDALYAQRRAYEARLELLNAYGAWFQAYVRLQLHAGLLSEDDIVLLDRQWVANKIDQSL